MSVALATTLLELIALALPAIGIYLQVLNSLQELSGKTNDMVAPDESLNFALARTSLFPLTIAGVVLIGYMMALQPPVVFLGYQNLVSLILHGVLYLSMMLLGVALLLFGASVGLRTKPHIMARPTKRGNIRLYFRVQSDALRGWLHNRWVDFRGIDTDEKRIADLDVVVWGDGQAGTGNATKGIATAHSEKQAQRIIDRGWAEETNINSENSEHHLPLTETGFELRNYYQEGFPTRDDLLHQNPTRFIEEALEAEQAESSESEREDGEIEQE